MRSTLDGLLEIETRTVAVLEETNQLQQTIASAVTRIADASAGQTALTKLTLATAIIALVGPVILKFF
jgi:hypothetical protein